MLYCERVLRVTQKPSLQILRICVAQEVPALPETTLCPDDGPCVVTCLVVGEPQFVNALWVVTNMSFVWK